LKGAIKILLLPQDYLTLSKIKKISKPKKNSNKTW